MLLETKRVWTAIAIAAWFGVGATRIANAADAAPADYKAVEGVTGTIKSIGSDSMNNLMTLWAEGFKKMYPNVQVEIEGKGSATAPPALISGAAQFGPMSRAMKADEEAAFEAKFGYKPTAIATSLDMIGVFVHKDNPIKKLTLQQVDAVFSKNRLGGYSEDVTTWGQLGLKGEWVNKRISLYGRNSASGTYGYFKELGLFKGDYKDSVKEQPGSSSVVQGVASDKYAIGYSGIGYKTVDVRVVLLAARETDAAIEATEENAYSGEYPLARFLYLYINAKPGERLDPLRREFIKYVLSNQGQADVTKDGYYPLVGEMVRDALVAAGVESGGDKPAT